MRPDCSGLILALVNTTTAKVRKTYESSNTATNEEMLLPDPLFLWPEYLVTAVSAISITLSLRILSYDVN